MFQMETQTQILTLLTPHSSTCIAVCFKIEFQDNKIMTFTKVTDTWTDEYTP